jgi:TetR/AcrR family transcriptional regulator, regulator of cefoperazone and chloramphenicol sensitivity
MRRDGGPRRHPSGGGYARGEETRARIIATALRAFGQKGYLQASTRAIAAEAGVNPPALQYYFGSKEGLHRACAQHIIDRVSAILAPALSEARRALRAGARHRARTALIGLLDAMADGLLATGAESWSRFIARGKVDGAGPAMNMLRERIGRPLTTAASELIALATQRPVEDVVTRLRACALLGQVSTFYANRENTLAAMNWTALDPPRLALIKAVVREHTRAALRASVRIPSRPRARTASRARMRAPLRPEHAPRSDL